MPQKAWPRTAPAPFLGRNRSLRGASAFPGPVCVGFRLSQRLARRRRRWELGLAPRPGPAGSAGNRAPAAASHGQAQQPRSRRDSKLMRGKPQPFCVRAQIVLPSLLQGCPRPAPPQGDAHGADMGLCSLPPASDPVLLSVLLGKPPKRCGSASPRPQREQGICPSLTLGAALALPIVTYLLIVPAGKGGRRERRKYKK